MLKLSPVLEWYDDRDAPQGIVCSGIRRLNRGVGSRPGMVMAEEDLSFRTRKLIERKAKCRARYGLPPKWVRCVTIH